MSKISEMVLLIEDEIRFGPLSCKDIADKYNVSTDFVQKVWETMCEDGFSD